MFFRDSSDDLINIKIVSIAIAQLAYQAVIAENLIESNDYKVHSFNV
jgi:hypothetical protein